MKRLPRAGGGKRDAPAAFRRLCVETCPFGVFWFGASPAAFRRLCVETFFQQVTQGGHHPAAFRRLCVETFLGKDSYGGRAQPPSGGCVLKPPKRWYSARSIKPAAFRRLCVETHTLTGLVSAIQRQPPSGGCVLKRQYVDNGAKPVYQPPSGGCVLKHAVFFGGQIDKGPAAFRRLCVETALYDARRQIRPAQPPSGGCVLKPAGGRQHPRPPGPAAFRRLCVETGHEFERVRSGIPSRLQAAVC